MEPRRLVRLLTGFAFACILMTGCGNVNVNFLLNGEDLAMSVSQPEDINDTQAILSIYVGDSLFLTDDSMPIEGIKTRLWDTNGDGNWEKEFQNMDKFYTSYSEKGVYQIKFCVNGEKRCVSKWLNVEEDALSSDNLGSMVTFINPPQLYNVSESKEIEIKVQTENIFSKDELVLTINDASRSFDFDEATGVLSKNVLLKRGKNRIEVSATGGEELVREYVEVDYQKRKPIADANSPRVPKNNRQGNSSSSKPVSNDRGNSSSSAKKAKISPPIQKPPPVSSQPNPQPQPKPAGIIAAPTIQIQSPRTNSTTKKATQEIAIKTTNLTGPKNLTILLNGSKVSTYKFSSQRGLWLSTLNLKPGKNEVRVIAKTNLGSANDRISIDYDAPTAPLTNNGTIALDSKSYSRSCSQAIAGNYTFYITPIKPVELIEFKLYSTICGGIEISMSSAANSENMKAALVKGKNQILLTDLYAQLEVGEKYTFSIKTFSGYGMCKANSTPRLEDASACSLTPINKPEINMDTQGKSIIYDLKYLY